MAVERREFVKLAGAAALGAALWGVTGCTSSGSGSNASSSSNANSSSNADANAQGNPGGSTRPAAPGTSKLQEVLKRGKLLVGTGSTNPPWHFEDDKGNLVGFDIEIAGILAKGLFDDPKKVEFVRQKPDARIPNLQSGTVDICIQFMTVNAQRAQVAEFTIPYYREGVNLLLPANSPFTGAASIRGNKAKISALQNNFAEQMVREAVPDAEVVQFDTPANSLLAMDSGRAAATAIDDSTARWYFAQFPGKYKVGDTPWWPQTYAAGVRPGDSVWLNFVNTVLHEAMSGVEWPAYKAAFKKYFGADLRDPQTGFPVELGAR